LYRPPFARSLLLAREGSGQQERGSVPAAVPGRELVPVDVTIDDYERMAELVELYADWPLGGTDASLIASAERLRVTMVATLDRRHFSPIQPRHTQAFTLLPETL
jgi:predicted nucleic acid-binding protein